MPAYRSSLVRSLVVSLLPASLVLAAPSVEPAPDPAAELEAAFFSPPAQARPYVWWHWMGSNFSKEGITADLEAMRHAGIGGATIFNLTSAVQESHAPTLDNPWPDQTYRSPKYWEAMRHAAAEAKRLGLEIGLHNTVGYSTTGGPWVDEERSMQRLRWSQSSITGGARVTVSLPVPEIPTYTGWGKTGNKLTFRKEVAVLAVPAGSDKPLQPDQVRDLSKLLREDGTLEWDAPAGSWVVYRFIHASTGASPHPVPDDVLGRTLEVDKLSRERTAFHWDNVLGPLKQELGEAVGDSFKHLLIDSYEAGYQNWTPAFREEFTRRKGYDPLPWLVTLGTPFTLDGKIPRACVLVSEKDTARFEWDYFDVIRSLFQENGWEPASARLRAEGLALQFEPYGGRFDTVAGAALADLPMVEFWTGSEGNVSPTVIAGARAAGRAVVGAEAFTGRPEISQWTETPAALKRTGDGAFTRGVNRMVLHHWVHQPFSDRYQPGMGMGWWGTHFSRNQTWAEPGREFYRYLGRVQAVLQRGETPVHFVSVGQAAGGDAIPREELLTGVSVKDGRIVLRSGRSYAFLHVPHDGTLLPEIAAKLRELLAAGATIVAPKPVRSPSLAGQPAADAEIARLAAELWGGGKEALRTASPGTLIASNDPEAGLRALRLRPFHEIAPEGDAKLKIGVHHRRTGAIDVFFIANGAESEAAFTFSTDSAGRLPELWNPETGTMDTAPLWSVAEGRVRVSLRLGSAKSILLVLRRAAPAGTDPLVAVEAPAGWRATGSATGRTTLTSETPLSGVARFASGTVATFDLAPAAPVTLPGAWSVELRPKLGQRSTLSLDKLVSLSSLETPAARYFSGTAIYTTTVDIPAALLGTGKRLRLDLGDVRDLVSVRLNGLDLGVLWHPPFERDITAAARAGANTLELAVTNTWHNRLVGDEQEPLDVELGTDRGPTRGRALLRYPQWLINDTPRPSTGRVGFVNWFYHRPDTKVIPSGLLGPVRLVPVAEAELKPSLPAPRPPTAATIETRAELEPMMKRFLGYPYAKTPARARGGWQIATYFTGVQAAYRATKDPAYLAASREWAELLGWKYHGRVLFADDLAMGQIYLDLHVLDPKPERLAGLLDQMATYYDRTTLKRGEFYTKWRDKERPFTGRNLWWWCDALYMAPPVLARLSEITGDPRHVELMDKLYWDTVEQLYDTEEHLFFRDFTFLRKTTPSGRKLFWSRGNGWVYAGLVHVLDHLPKDAPRRADYLRLFREMTGALLRHQGADGLWRSSLNDPEYLPAPEASGTAFFCFGLLAGVNRGWLDEATHLPPALKAWAGLKTCLTPEGLLGHNQGVAEAPGPTRPGSTIDYAQGAFLLAASELHQRAR